jgi:hypothetical protein
MELQRHSLTHSSLPTVSRLSFSTSASLRSPRLTFRSLAQVLILVANLATHLLLMMVTLNWLVNSYRTNGSPISNASLRAAAAKWLVDPRGASALYGAIGTWDTSSVTDMGELFLDAKDFNENIGAWDVSRVVQMDGLFEGATAFNQNLASWDVSKVVAMNRMFARASSFNQSLETWDVSKVKDFTAMFSGATAFDQVLAKWDTSKVQDMRYMFHGATRFNQPLESWDMSRCTDMSYMFWGASAFNRPIEKLRVSNVQGMLGVVTPHPRNNKKPRKRRACIFTHRANVSACLRSPSKTCVSHL